MARLLKVGVGLATLKPISGDDPAVLTVSAAHLDPDNVIACQKDAMVAIAGPLAQHRYHPHKSTDIARRWRERPFYMEGSDCHTAMSFVARMYLLQNGQTVGTGPLAIDFDDEQGQAYEQLLDETMAQTRKLIEAHWDAIKRVAAALLAEPALTEADVDALIADRA
ncbi:hypothetical protein [Bradyrhizobium septentrionale]|uniref:Uncharacterized protein n=1 Tax=Bradyrhizobium septentrionale TaxID=1404411 RepID=A0ABZ2P4W4_9BRAD|nr:hypothetical protein [Bradyrhizobium septentrionale]UGY16722.1 hypothetical protein HAP48_0003990 [Bradyrhizobium septentrionale]